MPQSRHRHVRILAARIGHVVRGWPGLFDPRNDLTPDRIVRIILRQKVKKGGGYREREFVTLQQNAAAFLVTQFQMFFKLSKRGDPVLEMPSPVVPEFLTNFRPIPRRVRDELFSVPFFLGVHFQLWTKKLRALNTVSMQALGRSLRTR